MGKITAGKSWTFLKRFRLDHHMFFSVFFFVYILAFISINLSVLA